MQSIQTVVEIFHIYKLIEFWFISEKFMKYLDNFKIFSNIYLSTTLSTCEAHEKCLPFTLPIE
jgi:hypothetical protein